MQTLPVKHISVSINRPVNVVYEFASNPENLPQWASGLSSTIRHVDGKWFADSPMGAIEIRFADENPFGVLDHEVFLPSGERFYNPMRVFPNQEGSELLFTLFRRPEMSDEEFMQDANAITKDLAQIKAILEK